MSDRDTGKLCPACGTSEAPSRLKCHLCGGTGLVDTATWTRWHARRAQPGIRASSTAIRAVKNLDDIIKELGESGTTRGYSLSVRGRRILDMIESWNRTPAESSVCETVYNMASDWIVEARRFLDQKKGDP